jgi:hypothetical protein
MVHGASTIFEHAYIYLTWDTSLKALTTRKSGCYKGTQARITTSGIISGGVVNKESRYDRSRGALWRGRVHS